MHGHRRTALARRTVFRFGGERHQPPALLDPGRQRRNPAPDSKRPGCAAAAQRPDHFAGRNHGHEQRRRNYWRITNGNPVVARVVVKPDLQHPSPQITLNTETGKPGRVEDQGPSRRLHRAARTGRRRSGDGHRVVRPDINRKVATSIARTIGGMGFRTFRPALGQYHGRYVSVSTDRILYYSRKVWQLRLNYIPLRSVLA